MVKGISRQVIVIKSPDQKVFEQAIFILREDAKEVSDEMLLREAQQAASQTKGNPWTFGPVWACAGAVATGILWLVTALL